MLRTSRFPSKRTAMDIETRNVWLRLKFSVGIFILVLIVGTFGFWFLEDNVKTLLDSFFFTLVTVTTIGYGNITPQTLAGKFLDIGVILSGVGAALVAVQTLFEVVIKKKIREVLKLPQGAVDMKNHFIVCGYGKVGKALGRSLLQKDLPYVVIEMDSSKVKGMVEDTIPVIEGDARKEQVLERAGVLKAKYLLASLDDAANVFVTLTAKMLNPSLKVICKIEDHTNEAKLKKAGADETISCHDMGARMMIEVAQT